MTVENPLVSAIIPVFNGEAYLAEAIRSALEQDYQPLEVIVLDDGSTDGTAAVSKSFGDKIRYHFQPHAGVSTTRNKALELAKGQLIAFLDADDRWTPNKVTVQVRHMKEHPQLHFTNARLQYFLEQGCPLPLGFKEELLSGDHLGRLFGTLVAWRWVFENVGGFDGSLTTAEDVDWFARASDQKVPMAVLPDVLLHKRVHGNNLSLTAPENDTNLLTVLRRSIARKRSPRPEPGKQPGGSSLPREGAVTEPAPRRAGAKS
jgi:glycosyltransferase involved in cell wall biosynthesis